MKNFLVLLILICLGYFAYQSFIHSDAVNQESTRDRLIREEGLEEFESSLPAGGQEAIIQAKADTDTFFDDIQIKINELRVIVNEKIEAL